MSKWSTQYGHDRVDFEVAGRRGLVIFPDVANRRKPLPWVWYAPTIGGYPGKCTEWICKRLLDKGVAICGVDVGESYGNPDGREVFTAFHDCVVKEHGLTPKARLWMQSRGGLQLINWASEHPELVERIGGTYPVCSIASYPGIATASEAYGMTDAELRERLHEHNPIDRLAPIAAKKIPILLIHGDSDVVVPLEANSAVLAERYKALGGPVELVVIPGKGHAEIPEFFENQRMVDFFLGGL